MVTLVRGKPALVQRSDSVKSVPGRSSERLRSIGKWTHSLAHWPQESEPHFSYQSLLPTLLGLSSFSPGRFPQVINSFISNVFDLVIFKAFSFLSRKPVR